MSRAGYTRESIERAFDVHVAARPERRFPHPTGSLTMTDTVRLGDRRMSFEMQPLGTNGQAIKGGNHYANANTIERAREWAEVVVAKGTHLGYQITGVRIVGQLMEFYGPAWRPVTGPDRKGTYEIVRKGQ